MRYRDDGLHGNDNWVICRRVSRGRRVFNNDSGAVGENLGYAISDFVGIITHRDRRIGTELGRVSDHRIIGLSAGLLGTIGEKRNVATEQRLDSWPDGVGHASRTHREAAYNAKIFRDPVTAEVVGRHNDHDQAPVMLRRSTEVLFHRTGDGSARPVGAAAISRHVVASDW